MEEIIFREAKESEYARLAAMAKELWHSAYDGLLGAAQTEYMTDEFQSEGALREQIDGKGYRYYFIERGGAEIGYCGVQPQGDKFFLSKLYLSDDCRGRGIGQAALSEVARLARKEGARSVYLTVNKGNARAVRAYEKFGFRRAAEAVTDIGRGYCMDDYIYEFIL